jgi:hypothetical protein
VDPADWRQPTPQFGDTLKPDPVRVTTVVPGRGPKSARQAVPVDSAGRFSFTITAPDTIRLTRAVLVDGDAVASPVVKGPFLFVLRAASGNIVHVGSLVDPLEEHSFLVDSTHTVGRAREGSFGLWIPGRLLGTQQLVGLTLEFYDARAVTLPPTLDVGSVGDFLPQARSLTRFPGTALVSALQRGAQE